MNSLNGFTHQRTFWQKIGHRRIVVLGLLIVLVLGGGFFGLRKAGVFADTEPGQDYADVSLDSPQYWYIHAMKVNNIIPSCDSTPNFCPGNSVSRENLMTYIAKAANLDLAPFGSRNNDPNTLAAAINDITSRESTSAIHAVIDQIGTNLSLAPNVGFETWTNPDYPDGWQASYATLSNDTTTKKFGNSSLKVTSTAANIIPNSSFETAGTTNPDSNSGAQGFYASTSKWRKSSDNKRSGSSSMKWTNPASTAVAEGSWFWNWLPLQPNTQYTYTGWIYSDDQRGYGYIDFSGAGCRSNIASAYRKWTQVSCTFTSGPLNQYGNPQYVPVRLVAVGGQGSIYFDDLTLAPTNLAIGEVTANINLPQGNYEASAWIKMESGLAGISIPNKGWAGPIGPGDWQRLAFSFSTDGATPAQVIKFGGYGPFTAYLDDVKVYPTDSLYCDTNKNFCPTRDVLRDETAALIAHFLDERLNEIDPNDQETWGANYTDLPTSARFFKEIQAATADGIFIGCEQDNPDSTDNEALFCPERVLRRDEAAEVLVRAFGLDLYSPTVIRGKLTIEGGAALDNAVLILEGDYVAITDAEGNYILDDNLPPGGYELEVIKNNVIYLPPNSRGLIEVGEGEQTIDISGLRPLQESDL